MRKKLVKKIKAADGQFLDPQNVGSSVRYSFETELRAGGRSHIEGNVWFTDCNRTICWSTNWDEVRGGDLQKKLDKAVDMLMDAREELARQIEVANMHKAEYEKGKKGKRKNRK